MLPTFGIVTFRRPDKLQRLYDSIQRFYPSANVVIADNGCRPPITTTELLKSPLHSVSHILQFDCGLSASRNFLADHTNSDLLILDDDFEFTQKTDISQLQDVLAHDERIGIVCGDAGVTVPQDLHDGKLVPSKPNFRKTENGTTYQLCQFSDNFMLIRRAVFQDGIRWNPALKVNEHLDFFQRVATTKWLVAKAVSCRIKHNTGSNSPE